MNAPTYLIYTDCIHMIFSPTTITFTNVIQTRPTSVTPFKVILINVTPFISITSCITPPIITTTQVYITYAALIDVKPTYITPTKLISTNITPTRVTPTNKTDSNIMILSYILVVLPSMVTPC